MPADHVRRGEDQRLAVERGDDRAAALGGSSSNQHRWPERPVVRFLDDARILFLAPAAAGTSTLAVSFVADLPCFSPEAGVPPAEIGSSPAPSQPAARK